MWGRGLEKIGIILLINFASIRIEERKLTSVYAYVELINLNVPYQN